MSQESHESGLARDLVTKEDNPVIEFSFNGTARLSLDEVWPDGNAPDFITAEAVVKRVKESATSISEFLDSWCLDRDVEVTAMVPVERDEKRHATLYDTADVRF